jgi:S1-C subfamily serine protease
VAEIFKQVNGSVTVIVALHKVSLISAGLQQTMGLNVGAGVLVSENGKVITSAHLVHTADQIKVKLSSGEIVGARVVASDPFADVSLLQLESVPDEVMVAKLGDSEKVEVGDEVFVVGTPYEPARSDETGRYYQCEGAAAGRILQLYATQGP